MLRRGPILFLFYALVLFLAITVAQSLRSRSEAPSTAENPAASRSLR